MLFRSYAPDFFDEGRHSPWGAAIDFAQPAVREFFIENALYWLMEYRFDGLRFDAVHAIVKPGTPSLLADLSRAVTIRGEQHSVVQAINRQLAHYPYHCGQIVFLAKHFRGREWKSLSIPRGKSTSFNERVAKGEASQR